MIGTFLDWLTHAIPGNDGYWRRRRLGRLVKPLCSVVGHDPQGEVRPVWSTSGPFLIPPNDPRTADYGHGCVQPYSGIVYFMRECSRCKKRIPVDNASAAHKAAKTAEIAGVMNAARARYGLHPISWDD